MTKHTPHRDPVSKEIVKQQPSYPAGRGIVKPSHEHIAPAIEREQKRQNDGKSPSRK